MSKVKHYAIHKKDNKCYPIIKECYGSYAVMVNGDRVHIWKHRIAYTVTCKLKGVPPVFEKVGLNGVALASLGIRMAEVMNKHRFR